LNAQTCQCELFLVDAVHQPDTGDRDRRIFEAREADHHSDALLYASMVLANRSTHLHQSQSAHHHCRQESGRPNCCG
jgi:hypothetical protein